MTLKKFHVIVASIVLATTVRIFYGLSAHPIATWDESKNFAVVRDTNRAGSFPVLRSSESNFFEKPPLWYYSTMAVTGTLGESVVSFRIISAVSGFILILLTTYISWRYWGGEAGVITWLTLMTTNHLFATNPGGSFSTHTLWSADVDSLHMLLMMISFAYVLDMKNKSHAYVAGIAGALSVLAKSPMGLLPLVTVSVLGTHRPAFQHITHAWMAAAMTIIPWYGYMILRFGYPFLSSHVGYHVAARISQPLEGHAKPIWYFVQVLSARHFFLSWELLLGSTLYLAIKKIPLDTPMRMTSVLALCTFIIPTLTSTKLAWYLLPFYPFAALLIGFTASRMFPIRRSATY